MVGNIFYEHSHRLVASGVGLLTIALTFAFWLRERRYWLRRLGVAALLLVILQGVIGGLRVVLLENTLAIVHAAFAQAFLPNGQFGYLHLKGMEVESKDNRSPTAGDSAGFALSQPA
jgi:heme A synthase